MATLDRMMACTRHLSEIAAFYTRHFGFRGAQVKLVFDIEDAQDFCRRAGQMGLAVGPIHEADGYLFSNAKNPSGNSIQVSGRAFRRES